MDNRKTLLIASFLTLVAAGMGFATRGAAGPAWAAMGIDSGNFGMIMGYGFLGFGFVIFFGGIIVEFLGYKNLLLLSVVLHFISALMILAAPRMYAGWVENSPAEATDNLINLLKYSVLLFSICAGLYEAVINPLVGQLYPENQTHYLNILHAGWPGGIIIGGVLAACFQNETAWITEVNWEYAVSSYSLVLVGLTYIILKQQFPDTVATKNNASFGVLFSCFLSIPFLVLIVAHALIGYMELGVDSWQTRLMERLVENSVTVLIYTSLLMFVLRFFAGPIVHRINPIGLLLLSSFFAIAGLLWLGSEIESVAIIFAAATVYSLGKAFLWPTMLAIAGERYPQSGAIAMSTLGAAGMISVGFIGGAMIGAQQSQAMSESLQENNQAVLARYKGDDASFLGFNYGTINPAMQQAAMDYHGAIDDAKRAETLAKVVSAASEAGVQDDVGSTIDLDSAAVTAAFNAGGRAALTKTALIPVGMAICFLGLLFYYKSIGGYKVISLDGGSDADESGDDESGSGDATNDADPLAVTTVEEGAEECCGGDEDGGEGDGGG
ncbi:MAG: MFS transporter [Planctomycetaceae bacterium]|nr:MFS transporter [Planctomycetaceae bacterium]